MKNCSWTRSHTTELKVKTSEDCVSRMLIQNYGRASNISCLLDSPEADILLTTADQLVVVDWAEL